MSHIWEQIQQEDFGQFKIMPKGELELHCHTIEIHCGSKNYARSSSLNYSGSKIETKVSVGAFNHEGGPN